MHYCTPTKIDQLRELLACYKLELALIDEKKAIPGSFWGGCEAGLIEHTLFVRYDTPIHSALHEACHYICMDANRRNELHTNAGGDYAEENGVCYLQILLGEKLQDINRLTMFKDMDKWGYSFRLGSTEKWFYTDADDARTWLIKQQIINTQNNITGKLRIAILT